MIELQQSCYTTELL